MFNKNISELGFKKGSILECIITTYNTDGSPNAAPMGVCTLNENEVLLKIHTFSDSYKNLMRNKACVINVVLDPLLFIKTAVMGQGKGIEEREVRLDDAKRAKSVKAPFLIKAKAYLECKLKSHEEHIRRDPLGESEISNIICEVVDITADKYGMPVNRGLCAAVELAVLLSRGKKVGIKHYIRIMQKTLEPKEYKSIEKFLRDRGIK